jgi:hypothetical protein
VMVMFIQEMRIKKRKKERKKEMRIGGRKV